MIGLFKPPAAMRLSGIGVRAGQASVRLRIVVGAHFADLLLGRGGQILRGLNLRVIRQGDFLRVGQGEHLRLAWRCGAGGGSGGGAFCAAAGRGMNATNARTASKTDIRTSVFIGFTPQ